MPSVVVDGHDADIVLHHQLASFKVAQRVAHWRPTFHERHDTTVGGSTFSCAGKPAHTIHTYATHRLEVGIRGTMDEVTGFT